MTSSIFYPYIFILVMALGTYLCRVLGVILIRRPIQNTFVQSFLYYVPYVTLSVMTFPAICEATRSPVAGFAAFAVGILCARMGGNLFLVAGACCGVVLVMECFL